MVIIPASQYCDVDHVVKNEGYAAVDNDHVMIATAISQVALISTGIPKIVNSFIEPGNSSETFLVQLKPLNS